MIVKNQNRTMSCLRLNRHFGCAAWDCDNFCSGCIWCAFGFADAIVMLHPGGGYA